MNQILLLYIEPGDDASNSV